MADPVIDLSKTYFGADQDHQFHKVVAAIVQTSGESATPDTTIITKLSEDSDGNVTNAKGITVPSAESGYALECMFVDTDKGAGTHKLYRNIGTTASCTFDLAGTVSTADLDDNAVTLAKMDTDSVASDEIVDSSVTGADIAPGTIPSGDLINPQAHDAGVVPTAVLAIAGDIVEAEKVVIGADTYEFEVVNTDTTDDTQGGDFTNTTDPLTVTDFTTNYPNSPATVGLLVRIENEIMVITGVDGADVTFARGVSGTTTASHADAADVYAGDGIVAGVAVGIVATLTPAVATPALVADINNRGTEAVLATSLQVGAEMLVEGADGVGGTAVVSAVALAVSETLSAGGSEWDTGNMRGGKIAAVRPIGLVSHVVDALEVTLGFVRIPLDFTPTAFIVQVYSATGLKKEDITDLVTISGNRIQVAIDGATHIIGTDVLQVMAW